jgi:hypothetical protein
VRRVFERSAFTIDVVFAKARVPSEFRVVHVDKSMAESPEFSKADTPMDLSVETGAGAGGTPVVAKFTFSSAEQLKKARSPMD